MRDLGKQLLLGNLLMQMIATGELKDIPAARTCIQTSFPTEIYHQAIQLIQQ